MSNRQYIGARYVPKFYEGSNGDNWDSGVSYEPLTIVQYLNDSYTSKKPVPNTVGNPAQNTSYWAHTGAYNAQVEAYHQSVLQMQELIGDEELETEAQTIIGAINDLNVFITPEMFGAVADGITDDYQAFVDAIEYAHANHCTIVLPSFKYYIGTKLKIDYAGICIEGVGAGVYHVLIAPNGISIKYDNTMLKHFWLQGDNSTPGTWNGTAISFDSDALCDNILIEDVYFSYYDNCIGNTAYFFGLTLKDCRFYSSNWVMKNTAMSSGNKIYDVNFIDCWFLSTTKLFDVNYCRIDLNSCIVDINSTASIKVDSLSDLLFKNCEFEMTTYLNDSNKYVGYIFGHLSIESCNLVENCDGSIYWFVLGHANTSVEMIDCRITSFSPQTATAGLVNPTFSGDSRYECFTILNSYLYYQKIFEVDNSGLQFTPRFNIVDGIGVKIVDGYYDTAKLQDNHIYSRYNAANTVMIDKNMWVGGYLRPITEIRGFNKGEVGTTLYLNNNPDGSEYTFDFNGYLRLRKLSTNTTRLLIKLYASNGTTYVPFYVELGDNMVVPVFAHMKCAVNNFETGDTAEYYPFVQR